MSNREHPSEAALDAAHATLQDQMRAEVLDLRAAARGRHPIASMKRALAAALAEADERDGWDPMSRTPHPTGGYTLRAVSASAGLTVGYRDDQRRQHRLDGPATVLWSADGQASLAAHFAGGRRHRLDGPSAVLMFSPPSRKGIPRSPGEFPASARNVR